jgi:hypothetical protein
MIDLWSLGSETAMIICLLIWAVEVVNLVRDISTVNELTIILFIQNDLIFQLLSNRDSFVFLSDKHWHSFCFISVWVLLQKYLIQHVFFILKNVELLRHNFHFLDRAGSRYWYVRLAADLSIYIFSNHILGLVQDYLLEIFFIF